MSQANKIVGATFIIMGVTFLSKIIGFIREVFIAAVFGTSYQADVFVAVSTIPNLLLTITGGALAAALIPIIIKLKNTEKTDQLKKLISSVFSVTSLIMILLVVFLYFFTEAFVDIYVAGFGSEARNLTIEAFQYIIPALFAIGITSFFSAILNANQHFFIPSLGPVLYSSGVIIAAIFFAKTYGVKSLIIGMAIGIFLQFILAFTMVLKKGIRFTPTIWWTEELKQVGKLIFPILLGVGVFQINIIVDRMMASSLAEGSIAALNYGNRVTQLPLSIFVGAMVLPLFPTIAEKIANNDIDGTKRLLSKSYRLLGILLLPMIGAFVTLSEPIIAILFQRGNFGEEAVGMTSIALAFYAFTIFPFAMRDVITRALYSLQDTWTPVINSIFLVTVNVILMIILVPKIGLIGVAGSTSLSSFLAYVRIRSKLNQKIGKIKFPEEKGIWLVIWRNAILFTGLTWFLYNGLAYFWSAPTGIELWLRTIISGGIGAVGYIILTLRMKTEEVEWIKARYHQLVNKVFKKGINAKK